MLTYSAYLIHLNYFKRLDHCIFFKLLPLSLAIVIYVISILPVSVYAHSFKTGSLHIRHPYAIATAPGQTVGGVFFKAIDNQGNTIDYLLSAKVSSSIANKAELHVMNTDNDIMRMRKITTIKLPAQTTVPMNRGLKHLGYHIMLMNLKKPLVAGETFNLILYFKQAGKVTVVVNIEPMIPLNSHESVVLHTNIPTSTENHNTH